MKKYICILLLSATAAFGQAINSNYSGPDGGLWNDPANWSPTTVPNNGGGNAFNVTIDGALVELDLDVTVNNLDLNPNGGYLLDHEHQFTAASTTIGDGLLQLTGKGTIDLGNLADFSNDTLNSGDIRIDATMPGQLAKVQFNGADIVNNFGFIRFMGPDARLEDEDGNNAFRNFALNGPGALVRLGYGSNLSLGIDFHNAGLLIARQGSTFTFSGSYTSVAGDGDDGLFEFYGTDQADRAGDGKVIVTGTFGNQDASGKLTGKFILWNYGTAQTILQYNDANITDVAADIFYLEGPNARVVDQNNNDALRNWARVSGAVDYTNGTQVGARTVNISGNFANDGTFGLVGGAQFNVAGNFTTTGLLVSDVIDLYQFVAFDGFPVSEAGALSSTLSVAGNCTFSATNEFWAVLVGPEIIGQTIINGTATLGGRLTLLFSLNDDSAATPDAVFTILTSNHPIVGQFSNVASGGRLNAYFFGDTAPDFDTPHGSFRVNYDGNALTLSDYQPALPADLRNISTRLDVQTGDNAGIAGFIVTGAGSKQVLLRAVGPSLNVNGTPVPGRLEDPVLELHDNNGALLTANDDWRNSPNMAAIEATGLAPASDLESAILQTLTPGAYTAIIRGKNSTNGIGLIEVYDVGAASDAKLANLSTRGLVETGDNVLIGGLVAGTPYSGLSTMVVRAVGPSLAQHGVPNPLQDPVLEIHDADGNVVATNDSWMSDPAQQAQIESYGLGLADPREAAVVITMASGPRTAVVRGAGGTTGIGLVEIYNVGAPMPAQSQSSRSAILRRSRQPKTVHPRFRRGAGKAQ